MDSSSLHEAQKEDGKVIQQINFQEREDETEEIEDELQQQTDIITYMGYELYWAAERGKINNVMLERRNNLQSLLTPNKNTILHIYITSTSSEDLEQTEFVRQVLTMCPELLMQPNAKKETPLHIAARYGRASIVELLIQHAKALHPQNLEGDVEAARQMMRMPNQNQDTACHEVVRFQHLSMVKILIREDCDFVHSANEEGETPLYMAAERGYSDIVFEILDKCKSPATGGPDGRNVLHAATIRKERAIDAEYKS
nr:26S proteasome non-ATPase regulatory subunit 10-like [Ziziphus jujuba var. spinosa]